jgi:hypothetical protein
MRRTAFKSLKARDTYGLTNEQRRFIDLGYRAGQSGTFGSSP